MSDRKLYNVMVRVVNLTWATSPEEAIRKTREKLEREDFTTLPDGADAFVSEPVPMLGWLGEGER